MGRLDGKVALVTGAASGIGLEACRKMVAAGAKVVAVDVRTIEDPPPGTAPFAAEKKQRRLSYITGADFVVDGAITAAYVTPL